VKVKGGKVFAQFAQRKSFFVRNGTKTFTTYKHSLAEKVPFGEVARHHFKKSSERSKQFCWYLGSKITEIFMYKSFAITKIIILFYNTRPEPLM
jgi:hypothetical protein